eukprot:474429_1
MGAAQCCGSESSEEHRRQIQHGNVRVKYEDSVDWSSRKKANAHKGPNIPVHRPIQYKASDEPSISDPGVPRVKRQGSVRNFGELFSTEFHHQTVHHYKSLFDIDTVLPQTLAKQNKIVQYFHDNYYGQYELFESPFGHRPVIYCDWTASGKLLQCVESYLEKEMYTLYANTHTTTSITGVQTSKFRSEARAIILGSLGGDPHEDAVIFTGSGVTGAIYKMSHILMKSFSKAYRPESTVVFVSVYEHNSNIFIWKELGTQLIVIPEDGEKGALDLKYLENKLKQYTTPHLKHKYNLLIGSFTAASNVSGIIAPIEETTALLHKYGAFSFWDYATAGPYMDVCMTNKDNPLLSKDAVFISTHKYLAGPGAPGILCAKKHLFQNYVPVIPGGGTVFAAYGVADGQWQYLDNIEEREEGGTPDIIGSVRAAFVFMIKDHLSTRFIEEREKQYLEYFLSETKTCGDDLVMMGNTTCPRLPVLSFLVAYKADGVKKYLHHNFIAALFNDLFGIQGRGGCACAGMYGLYTLGMNEEETNYVLNQMRCEHNELSRPGYFRINLHYTLNEKELKYIVEAVKYVCKNGWRFLPLYDVNKETGNYFHRDTVRKPDLLKKQLRTLLDVSFDEKDGTMEWKHKHVRVDGKALLDNLDTFFEAADDILDNLSEYLPNENEFGNEAKINDDAAWYWLPSELYHKFRL